MPTNLKALVVVLVLAAVVFAVVKAPACALATTARDFERRRNLWFAITLATFLSYNFWVFIVVTAGLLFFAAQREENKVGLYFSVLFAVPMISDQIPGLGIIQHFFTINYARLLALVVLLPAFLHLRKQADTEPFGRPIHEKFLVGYLILQFLLMLSASTLTNTLRNGFFYAFIDVFLPYYVASRVLRNLQGFRDALMAFAVAAMVMAAIAVFEFLAHWLLYASIDDAWGRPWGYGRSLEREAGVLRAQGSTGHAIPLGYVMAVAFGLFLYLRRMTSSATYWGLGLALLLAGLVAPISRGSWVGAAAMLCVFIVTSPHAGRRLVALGTIGAIAVTVLLTTSAGEKILQYLPFVGTVESKNVAFRQRLIEIAIGVILENPFFGAFSYVYSSAFLELKTGSGMIDIVNTYVGIALSSGLVGLSLFLGFFVLIAAGIFQSMRNLADRDGEAYLLGQTLLSTLAGILLIIVTTSSITVIPLVYWSVAGMGVAYMRLLAPARVPTQSRNEGDPRKGRTPYSRHAPAS